MSWKKLLESTKESLNDYMQLRNAYLVTENGILRRQIEGRVQLTNSKRKELAEMGAKLGKKALAEIATVAQPDTILAWHRKFANQNVMPSKLPRSVGRPRVDQEIEAWVIRMARENRSWGYDRIQGSLKHLGYTISDQTVGNILKRHGISPAPERIKSVTWREFIRSHWDVLVATGFFKSEVWSWVGLTRSYLLSFIHFSRHPADRLVIILYRFMLAMQAHVCQPFDLIPDLRSWASRVMRASQVRQDVETILEQTGVKVTLAEVRPLRLRDVPQGVVLSSVRRPIRDGPNQCQYRLDGLQEADYREAA